MIYIHLHNLNLITSQLTQQNTEDESEPNKPEQENKPDENISPPLLSLKTGKYPNSAKKTILKTSRKTFWLKVCALTAKLFWFCIFVDFSRASLVTLLSLKKIYKIYRNEQSIGIQSPPKNGLLGDFSCVEETPDFRAPYMYV